MVTIVQAETAEQVRGAQELFTEYTDWLRTDIDTVLDDMNDVPAMTGYQEEIAALPGKYAPPDGRLRLAYHGGQIAGCAALYKHSEGVGEIKRVWVRPPFGASRLAGCGSKPSLKTLAGSAMSPCF